MLGSFSLLGKNLAMRPLSRHSDATDAGSCITLGSSQGPLMTPRAGVPHPPSHTVFQEWTRWEEGAQMHGLITHHY